jgi:phage recombination protein Bet
VSEILRAPVGGLADIQEWESKIDLIRRTVAVGATYDELELFFHQARRAGLDPLAKQIYYIKRKGKGTIQVGIDGLRLIADRTGKYAGSDDAIFEGTTDRGYPAKARVTVYKLVNGQRCPFTATARWDEYYPGDDQGFQWRKMPHTMLAKCAEGLALRKSFPADTSGLYLHEEMDQADRIDAITVEGRDVVEAPKSTAAAPHVSQGEKERCARLFKSRVWKPTDDQFRDFVDYCEKEKANWAQVLLEAEDAGCCTHAQIMRYAVDGEKPAREPSRPPSSGSSPEGKNAFGYAPVRWPLPKMFQDPATDSQHKMWFSKCRERTLPEEDAPTIMRLVLESYGLEDDGSKAALSLAIDWVINADEESLDLAVAAAEAAAQDAPLELE